MYGDIFLKVIFLIINRFDFIKNIKVKFEVECVFIYYCLKC